MLPFRIASLALGLLVPIHLFAAALSDRTDWANVAAPSPGTALQLRVASPATPRKSDRLKGKLAAAGYGLGRGFQYSLSYQAS